MLLRTLVCRASVLAVIFARAAQAGETTPTKDHQITHQVERFISQHPEFGSQLTVQTHKGIVYIGGTPWSYFNLLNLEFIVRQTEGVRDVVATAIYPEPWQASVKDAGTQGKWQGLGATDAMQ
jgi:hypothetical protein